MCVRGLDPVSDMKSYSKRAMEGNDKKFKRVDEEYTLLSFAGDAFRHMKTYGMDTVFYMPDPRDSTADPLSLFTYHSRYTRAAVEKFVKDAEVKYFDEHAKTALIESGSWLFNSLDESLKTSIRPQLTGDIKGPVLWMLIVAEVQSDSLRRSKIQKEKFEALKLTGVKGENIREYAAVAASNCFGTFGSGWFPAP
jgi:hypothetical protein